MPDAWLSEEPGWDKAPAGTRRLDVCDVVVDADDMIYVLTRHDAAVLVYDTGGRLLRSWGANTFVTPHGLSIDSDGMLYVVDQGAHLVRKFTTEGDELLRLGAEGIGSDTGYDGADMDSLVRSSDPFNQPTKAAIRANGDIYVTDGYGNARVHRFDHRGELLDSWGAPGAGPGQFHLPHSIAVDSRGRLLVADRENDRIQVFSPDGRHLESWLDVQRPSGLHVDRQGNVYVGELIRRAGKKSYRLGVPARSEPARLSVFDVDGHLLHRMTSPLTGPEVWLQAPHGIATDSAGAVYVAEVTYTDARANGVPVPVGPNLRRFTPLGSRPRH